MHIATRRHERPPWTVISVYGDLDVVGAPDLRQEVVAAVAGGDVCLILDLSGVEFIDSFGLGVVIGSIKRVRQRDGDLALVCPEPRIRRVFELCDLDRVLPLHLALTDVPDPAGAPR